MLKGAQGRERWVWTERKVRAVRRALAGGWGDLCPRPAHCPTLCHPGFISLTDPPSTSLQSSRGHGTRTPTDAYNIPGSRRSSHSPHISWAPARCQALGGKSKTRMLKQLQVPELTRLLLLLYLCTCCSVAQSQPPHFVHLEKMIEPLNAWPGSTSLWRGLP